VSKEARTGPAVAPMGCYHFCYQLPNTRRNRPVWRVYRECVLPENIE